MEKKEIKKIDRRSFLKYSAAGAVALGSGSLLTGVVRDAFAAEKALLSLTLRMSHHGMPKIRSFLPLKAYGNVSLISSRPRNRI